MVQDTKTISATVGGLFRWSLTQGATPSHQEATKKITLDVFQSTARSVNISYCHFFIPLQRIASVPPERTLQKGRRPARIVLQGITPTVRDQKPLVHFHVDKSRRNSAAPCTAARAGYYVATTKATSNTACPKGQHTNTIACNARPRGCWCSSTGTSSPRSCQSGYHSPGGFEACLNCPSGTWSFSQGAASCDGCLPAYECPASGNVPQKDNQGYYLPGGLTSCIQCPTGTYSNTQGGTSCTDCPAGYECSTGANNPQAFPPGHYS